MGVGLGGGQMRKLSSFVKFFVFYSKNVPREVVLLAVFLLFYFGAADKRRGFLMGLSAFIGYSAPKIDANKAF